MRLQNEKLRESLAAEYVLGTLQGAARRRFAKLLQNDPALQKLVWHWEEKLIPMSEAVPPVQPPSHVWQAIQRRIAPVEAKRAFLWECLSFWRNLGLISTALVFALGVYIALLPQRDTMPAMMAVLNNNNAQPMMLVSWNMNTRDREMTLKMLTHPNLPANASWELWMLPEDKKPPISMGIVSSVPTQTIKIPAAALPSMNQKCGLAISLEPKGGSPTGQPTGPILYTGACIKAI